MDGMNKQTIHTFLAAVVLSGSVMTDTTIDVATSNVVIVHVEAHAAPSTNGKTATSTPKTSANDFGCGDAGSSLAHFAFSIVHVVLHSLFMILRLANLAINLWTRVRRRQSVDVTPQMYVRRDELEKLRNELRENDKELFNLIAASPLVERVEEALRTHRRCVPTRTLRTL